MKRIVLYDFGDEQLEIDEDMLCEFEDDSETVAYFNSLITDPETEEFDEDDLKDFESWYKDYNDTSDLHPNETFEEFMEHEDF